MYVYVCAYGCAPCEDHITQKLALAQAMALDSTAPFEAMYPMHQKANTINPCPKIHKDTCLKV
jgi:hypothetical protein